MKKFTVEVNKDTYLAVKLFPFLSLVKNKNIAPTVGNKISEERIGKFIYLIIKKVNKAEKPKSITKAYW